MCFDINYHSANGRCSVLARRATRLTDANPDRRDAARVSCVPATTQALFDLRSASWCVVDVIRRHIQANPGSQQTAAVGTRGGAGAVDALDTALGLTRFVGWLRSILVQHSTSTLIGRSQQLPPRVFDQ